jgi:hypothetical protein
MLKVNSFSKLYVPPILIYFLILSATLAEKVFYKTHSVTLLGRPSGNPHKKLNPLNLDTRIATEFLGQRTAKVVFVDKYELITEHWNFQ